MAAKKPSIDTKLIRDLADLLNETDLNEIEIEDGEMRLKLSRGGSIVAAPSVAHQTVVPVSTTASAPSGGVTPVVDSAAPASGTPITSPMVGTAYLSPAPEANPFVQVGDSVKIGQTIMIVEAMKTMNQIQSTHDGVISEINVEDGQPVEFGETLITLK